MKEANSYGITGMCNMARGGLASTSSITDSMKKASSRCASRTRRPSIRCCSYDDVLADLKKSKEYDSDMLQTQLAKIFYDGVTESGTAVMLEPYLESVGLGSDWYGEPIWTDEEFFKMVKGFDAEACRFTCMPSATAPFSAPSMPTPSDCRKRRPRPSPYHHARLRHYRRGHSAHGR